MDEYEEFHITGSKEKSAHVVSVLQAAGIRLRTREGENAGYKEYVVEVHPDDLDRATEIFWGDAGTGESATSGDDEPFVYDKAKYHEESIQGLGLPAEQAYNHTTFFLSWLIKNNLMSDSFEAESKDELAKYRGGQVSVNQVYEWWDTCLVSDMLSEEGNAFARDYFDFEKGSYLKDYRVLYKGLASEFHVKYTPDNEKLIHAAIDKRYAEWRAQASGGKG